MSDRGDVVHQIVSVAGGLTDRVGNALQATVREVVSRSLGITAGVKTFAEEVTRVVFVLERYCYVGQRHLGEIAGRVVGVAIDLAGRIGDLFNAALRVAHKGNRQIARAAGDAIRAEREQVSVETLDRLHLSAGSHRVHAHVRIGVLEGGRTVVEIERKEAHDSGAGFDKKSTAVRGQLAKDSGFGRVGRLIEEAEREAERSRRELERHPLACSRFSDGYVVVRTDFKPRT